MPAPDDFKGVPAIGETVVEQPQLRPSHPVPEFIGPYRIIETIGEGGMGIVYKAEQREPVRRVVAIKVIKLGMDTKEIVARFDAERQALALMNHPNVAKVLEAGITDAGKPYFAMEFVPGVSITSYCDTQKLTTRERLELFIPVCQAVQHAHQKGIIHRDLKPGNILITLFDGKPVPKVIDFGVAKATSIQLTQKTLFTQSGTMIGTAEYMSPEQATSGGLDVDTRTDVYSLGVILYQLLTDTLPFESESLRKAGIAGIARIIQDTDPPKPSARLTDAVQALTGCGLNSTEIAKRHGTNPRTLRRELQGDLDWIVLKAMEKDRTRRYESASGLVVDLRRHLTDEPVSACQPGAAYRLSKFVRRHKLGIISTTVLATTLFLGLVAVSYALFEQHSAASERALRENKQHDADEARRTAQRVSTMVQDVLSAVTAKGIRRTPVQMLDDVARLFPAEGLGGDPLVEAHARESLGRGYTAIGYYQRAISQFRIVVDMERPFRNVDFANSLNELADALVTDGDIPAAGPYVREASAIEEQSGSAQPETRALTLDLLGSVRAAQDDWGEASQLYTDAYEIRSTIGGESDGLADSIAHQGELRLHRGDASGRVWMEQALRMYRNVIVEPTALVGPVRRLARAAMKRGDWSEADQLLRGLQLDARFLDRNLLKDILAAVDGQLVAKPSDVPLLLRRADFLGRLGDFASALATYLRVLDLNPNDSAIWHEALPLQLQVNGVDSYRQMRRRALAFASSKSDARTMHRIAKGSLCFSISDDELAAAARMADEALKFRQNDPFYWQTKGMAEYRKGHFPEAIDWLTKSADHVIAYRDVLAEFFIAMALKGSGKPEQARAAYETGMQLWNLLVPKPGVDDLNQFSDWIFCDLARKEAEQVMRDENAVTSKP